jgi:hypothetical protein
MDLKELFGREPTKLEEQVVDSGNPAAIVALMKGQLENAAAASTPGGIEAQEAAGQKTLVASQLFPKKLGYKETWSQYEALGFKIIEPSDEIFDVVEFPEGWTREATDHNMWSKVLDEKGRKRVSVFYKAAFYDRSASAHLVRRYTVSVEYSYANNWQTSEQQAVIKDGNTIVKRVGRTVSRERAGEEYFNLVSKYETEANELADELYPDHRDPLAYWND